MKNTACAERDRKLLIVGILGCLLYVAGDFLYAATGKGQTTETIGLFVQVAYPRTGPHPAQNDAAEQHGGRCVK